MPSQAIYAIGTVAANSATTSFSKLLLNSSGINTSPLDNQAAQTSAVQMGTSGGNNNDVDVDPSSGQVTDCASGTLGALVQDQASNLYILSNNHVLAESDQGAVGNTIIQPGLVDTGCTHWRLASPVSAPSAPCSIGSRSSTPPPMSMPRSPQPPRQVSTPPVPSSLRATGGGTNQVAAAAPVAGTGEVLSAANISNIHVAKSGRTTGLTCTTVDAIDSTVKVSYYKDAAETQFYVSKTYTNQIGMPGNYFSDAGDSGSLVVDTANAQPLGLFYAGSTGT